MLSPCTEVYPRCCLIVWICARDVVPLCEDVPRWQTSLAMIVRGCARVNLSEGVGMSMYVHVLVRLCKCRCRRK